MNTNKLAIIQGVLSRLSFAPSCVDMAWKWEVESVPGPHGGEGGGGYLIRTTFRRPDRDTGKMATGYGRKWHVPFDATESAVVKTAYAAARQILEHELMESFRYEGQRLFDPHHEVDDLLAAVIAHRKRARSAGRS